MTKKSEKDAAVRLLIQLAAAGLDRMCQSPDPEVRAAAQAVVKAAKDQDGAAVTAAVAKLKAVATQPSGDARAFVASLIDGEN